MGKCIDSSRLLCVAAFRREDESVYPDMMDDHGLQRS